MQLFDMLIKLKLKTSSLLALFVLIFASLLTNQAWAVKCSAIFPGDSPFAGSGKIVTGANRPLCNGIRCSFESFATASINLGANLGAMPDSYGAATFGNQAYNYYDSVPTGKNYRLNTSGNTSVIYLSGNGGRPGSFTFRQGAGLNVPGTSSAKPEELLIIVNGDLTIEKNSVVNGFIYVDGNVLLEQGIQMSGAISATGHMDVEKNGRYDYDPSMLEQLDSHGFCDPDVQESFYQIRHDGSGLTCKSETVQVFACTDANCSAYDTSVNANVAFMVNGSSVQTVAINNGVGNVSFNYADTVNDAVLSLAEPFQCLNTGSGSNSSCNVNFKTEGFVFNGESSRVAGDLFSDMSIEAVADKGGICTALVDSNTDVQMALEYFNPTTSTANNYQINNSILSAQAGFPSGAGDYSLVNLNFDNAGVAPLVNSVYDDAGQIRLHARYVIPAVPATPTTPAQPEVVVEGFSDLYWVRPDTLTISAETYERSMPFQAVSLLNATTNTGTPTQAAGGYFKVFVEAINSKGNTTTNYQPSNDMKIEAVLVAPTIGSNGDLVLSGAINDNSVTTSSAGIEQNITLASFSAGKSFYGQASFSEVGIIQVQLKDINYDGNGLTVSSAPLVIGRFIPAYFQQIVTEHGSLMGSCGTDSSGDYWAYSGQQIGSPATGAIKYNTQPEILITAYNANGEVTENYFDDGSLASDDFMHIDKSLITLNLPTQDIKDGALMPKEKLALTSVLNVSAGTLTVESFGVVKYQLSAMDHFTYLHNKNSELVPFTAEFDIEIDNITDADGVTVQATTSPAYPIAAPATENIELRSGVNVRFGRLFLEHSFGPETRDLPQIFKTQYLADNNGNFVGNINDFCTPISHVTTELSLSDIGQGLTAADTSPTVGTSVMVAGEFIGIPLTATSPKQGQIGVTYSTPAWLQFDWANSGSHNQNPTAVATFGRFRGNDRIIYWREVNN